MALGGALFEAVHFNAGAITNGSFSDYRVPRIADVPPDRGRPAATALTCRRQGPARRR